MIRKIAIEQLLPGMYVVDLHCPWFRHSRWLSRFVVGDFVEIEKLQKDGVSEVSIDTERGIDIPPPPEELPLPPPAPRPRPAGPSRSLDDFRAELRANVSLDEERRRVGRLIVDAGKQVNVLIDAARAGSKLETGALEPLVVKMVDSIQRNRDALVPAARIQRQGDYVADHAVASAALNIALAQQQGMAAPEQEKMALGSLLKDIGHTALDKRLLDKREALNPNEVAAIRQHVEKGLEMLQATSRLPETTIAVILEHHERYDGKGYPYGLAGNEISLAGRMAAVADAFDAMTAERPHRAALSTGQALRSLYEESGRQFDPALVAAMVKSVGIYPVGTLVMLASGYLAVVETQNPGVPLTPVVRIIYHSVHRQYVAPVILDLSRKVGRSYGGIVGSESYARWGINPEFWRPV